MQPKKVDPTSPYWIVGIWPTADAMNTWIASLPGGLPLPDGGYAACCIHASTANPRFFGYICFHDNYLGYGIVAHELIHAAARSLGIRGELLTQDREELLAENTERLVISFWLKFYRYHHSQK
jgi:heme-degrading monooxygenase HmoA